MCVCVCMCVPQELSDLIKAVQLEQEGMAANVAMSAQLRGQQGAGGGNGGVDPATLQLVMATGTC